MYAHIWLLPPTSRVAEPGNEEDPHGKDEFGVAELCPQISVQVLWYEVVPEGIPSPR